VALERLVVVRAGRQVGWCVEQLLACGGFAGVLAWPETGIDARALRRLQVAAEGRPVFACLWRPTVAFRVPSPASLRVALSAGDTELSVRIVKRRGRPVSGPLALSVPRPISFAGRNPRAVAGPALSAVADRGLAAAPVA
jgi:cell division inhibitor SulA/protein ImuA